MAQQTTKHGSEPNDPFKMYASPTGASFLQKANKIFEDFPTSKYLLFTIIFTIEVIIAFWVGLHLVR